MKRFRRLPISLNRIQGKLPVSLRDYDSQLAKNRRSFDLKLFNNMVQPMLSEEFHTPNGMSLRPSNDKMVEILKEYKGEVKIFRMHEGVLLPPSLVCSVLLLCNQSLPFILKFINSDSVP